MFEQTNQTLPDHTAAADDSFGAALQSGMEQQPSAPENDSVPQPPAPPRYTVKYNGKEVELTLDELKTRAQMGMNYDHVKAENDRIKGSQLYQSLRRMAQAEGVGMEVLGTRLLERERATRIEQLTKSGMQPEAAAQYAAMEDKLAGEREKSDAQAPFLAFVRRFPDVTPTDISDAVWARFHETGDLIGAYTEAENERLHEQLRAMEQNKINAKAHIGSLANDRPSAPTDAFLEGLLGG